MEVEGGDISREIFYRFFLKLFRNRKIANFIESTGKLKLDFIAFLWNVKMQLIFTRIFLKACRVIKKIAQ